MLDGEGALGFDDIVHTTVCVCSTVSEDVLTWCTFKNIRKLVSMSAKCIMEPSAPPPLSIWNQCQDRDGQTGSNCTRTSPRGKARERTRWHHGRSARESLSATGKQWGGTSTYPEGLVSLLAALSSIEPARRLVSESRCTERKHHTGSPGCQIGRAHV